MQAGHGAQEDPLQAAAAHQHEEPLSGDYQVRIVIGYHCPGVDALLQGRGERDEASAGRGGQTGPRPARPAAPGAGPRQEEAARDQQIFLQCTEKLL